MEENKQTIEHKNKEQDKPNEDTKGYENGNDTYTVLEDDSLLPWRACWDANYQCYYYWNTETNETTYDRPNVSNGKTNQDNHVEGIDSAEYNYYLQQESINSLNAPAGSQYAASAHFNAKTGKFQADPSKNPENFSYEAKSLKQCSAFFDYNSFMEQRGTELQHQYSTGKKTKMTKKIIQKLKTRRQEKKLANKKKWLLED